MARLGYARVSTNDQDLSIQIEALNAAGCEIVRSEKMTGTTTEGRTELKTLLDFIRAGDTLVVTRIDRLARSIGDLLRIVETVRSRGATLKATEQPFDTGNIYGELTFNLLGVFADFENKLRRERQMEGIRKAKAAADIRGGQRHLIPARLRD